MSEYITNRNFFYMILCLVGITILIVTVSARIDGITLWILTIVGFATVCTGGVYYIDSVFLHQDKKLASKKWKISSNITRFLKVALYQIDMFIMGLVYIMVVTKIFLAIISVT